MLKISRIFHAGYIIESAKAKIAFDPIFEFPFSVNCYAFPSVKFDSSQIQNLKFDAVFISHFHDDHFSMESLNLLPRTTPIYMFTVFPQLLALLEKLGFEEVHALSLDKTIKIENISVTPRRALDADVDSIFQIESSGLKVLNVVDSWIDDETLELLQSQGPWDLIMWPFQTMRELEMIAPTRHPSSKPEIPDEWKEQLSVLKPRHLIPSSCQFKMEPWSWYNRLFFPISYAMFIKEMSQLLPHTKTFRLNPGESIELGAQGINTTARVPWIEALEDPEADYEFDLMTKVPEMETVAQNFPASGLECERVLHFCKTDLVTRFNSLRAEAHDYFENIGVWELSLYNADREYKILYEIKEGQLQLVERSSLPLMWRTQIPLRKVLGALENGESLSSLYIRINATELSEKFERYLEDVEVTEDPLLRVLYHNSLGSYQRAQLLRLGYASK